MSAPLHFAKMLLPCPTWSVLWKQFERDCEQNPASLFEKSREILRDHLEQVRDSQKTPKACVWYVYKVRKVLIVYPKSDLPLSYSSREQLSLNFPSPPSMLNQAPSPSLFYFVYKWRGKIDQLPLQHRTYLIVNSIEENYSCKDVCIWEEEIVNLYSW